MKEYEYPGNIQCALLGIAFKNTEDFLYGEVVKNPHANKGSIPGPGRSHMPRNN